MYLIILEILIHAYSQLKLSIMYDRLIEKADLKMYL